jgi:hypothetical protein
VTRDVPGMISFMGPLRVHSVQEDAAYDAAKPRRRKAESRPACVKELPTKTSLRGLLFRPLCRKADLFSCSPVIGHIKPLPISPSL